MTSIVERHAQSTTAEFLIYTTSFCPYCTAAKRFLGDSGLTWEEKNLDADPRMLSEIMDGTEHRTVPIIFDLRRQSPTFVGGFDQLRPYLS